MRGYWQALLGCLLLLIACPYPAAAQDGSLNPQAVQTWADKYFHDLMARSHVPGAVFVVVDHGHVVVARGYGARTPGGSAIDPQNTLFRLGSVTKTFTAIAATQMLDEKRIDLGTDVNHYLTQIQIPDTYGPITIRNLLAHEGGFGADLRGVDAPTSAGADIAPAEMQRLLVPRVRPPGEYIAYDNNGWGVLGLALANASHEHYRDMIAERVFRPLGMTHAAIGIPDAELSSVIEEHYVMPDGTVQRIDHQFLKPMEEGAGNASATGADMARYMIALLQGGEIDGKRVVTPAEFKTLTDFNSHRLHPMLPGYARAFYETREAGHEAFGHDGGMEGSACSMVLFPAEQIGVFWAVNARPYNPFDGETLTGVAKGIRMFLLGPKPKVSLEDFLGFLKLDESFAKEFLPPAPPQTVQTQGQHWLSDQEIADLAGTYVGTPSQFASFVGNLQVRLIEGLTVAPGGHRTVLIGGNKFAQIYPGLFENPKTHERRAFSVTPYGTFMGTAALWIMRRVGWYETPLLVVLPLLLFPLLLVFAVLYRLGRNPVYRRFGPVAAGLGVAFAVCVFLEGQYANWALIADQMWLVYLWRLVLQLVLVGLLIWPVLLFLAWRDVPPRRSFGGIAAVIHFLILAVCSWLLIVLAGYWDLLGKF